MTFHFSPHPSFTSNSPTVTVINLRDIGTLSEQFAELIVGDGVDSRLEGFATLPRV